MKKVEGINVMQMCLDRIIFLKHCAKEKQAYLTLAIKRNDTYLAIKRNEPYENIRELKAEIDSMNDELAHVTELYEYYEEKFDGIIF
jgi:ASC-1-like (ASCH) protein